MAVTDHPFRDLDMERAILEPQGYSVAEHQCGTADEVAHACADAVWCATRRSPAAVVSAQLERLPRSISRYGIGFDNDRHRRGHRARASL